MPEWEEEVLHLVCYLWVGVLIVGWLVDVVQVGVADLEKAVAADL